MENSFSLLCKYIYIDINYIYNRLPISVFYSKLNIILILIFTPQIFFSSRQNLALQFRIDATSFLTN